MGMASKLSATEQMELAFRKGYLENINRCFEGRPLLHNNAEICDRANSDCHTESSTTAINKIGSEKEPGTYSSCSDEDLSGVETDSSFLSSTDEAEMYGHKYIRFAQDDRRRKGKPPLVNNCDTKETIERYAFKRSNKRQSLLPRHKKTIGCKTMVFGYRALSRRRRRLFRQDTQVYQALREYVPSLKNVVGRISYDRIMAATKEHISYLVADCKKSYDKLQKMKAEEEAEQKANSQQLEKKEEMSESK